jgi:O-antigen/teichoic acid export membrane protein
MSTVSRSRAAFWGTLAGQIFTIIGMLVSIVSTPLMVKYLDKEEYGLSILFFQILGYLSLFDFGLGTATIRSLAIHQGDDDVAQVMLNRIVSTNFFAALVLGAVMVAGTFCLAPFIPDIFHLRADLAQPAVYIVISLSFGMMVQFVQRGLGGIFFAHHQQALIIIPEMFLSVLSLILTVVLLAHGHGLWSFVYANFTNYILYIIVLVIMLRYYYPKLRIRLHFFDKILLKSLFGFGFFLFLAGLATQVILYTDRLVIGKIISLAAVAVFSLTVRIPEVGMGLLARITDNAGPSAAEILNKGDVAQARAYFHRLMLVIAVLSTVALWIMAAMNEWFIRLWIGPSFFAGRIVLLLALIVMLQQTLTRAGVAFLNAKGIARPLSVMALVEATLNIALSIFLGYHLGLVGVLLGTVVAAALTSMWYVPQLLRKHIGLSYRDYWLRTLLLPIACLSALGFGLDLFVRALQRAGAHSWVSFLTIGSAVSVLMILGAWIGFLRWQLGEYVPIYWRRWLLVPKVLAAEVEVTR